MKSYSNLALLLSCPHRSCLLLWPKVGLPPACVTLTTGTSQLEQCKLTCIEGLILSLSLIFAAGAAAYENPEIKKWVDENRRKIAQALYQLGDELAPQPRRPVPVDVSTQEDNSPEAVERRQRAREEILERGRFLEERRRSDRANSGRPMSFDDLVHKDGSLRQDGPEGAISTATEPVAGDSGLRHRHDPLSVSVPSAGEDSSQAGPASQDTTPATPLSPPVPPKPAAYKAQPLLISVDDSPSLASDEHASLTPTTSTSSASADFLDSDAEQERSQPDQYMPVGEWAHHQSVQSLDSFHSPPASLSRSSTPTLENVSVADSLEHVSQAGTEDADAVSEFEEGINTPSTWTEVGSQFSGE